MNKIEKLDKSGLMSKITLLDIMPTNIEEIINSKVEDREVFVSLESSGITTNFTKERLDELSFSVCLQEGERGDLYTLIKIPVFPTATNESDKLLVVAGKGTGRFYDVAFVSTSDINNEFRSGDVVKGQIFEASSAHDEVINDLIEKIESVIADLAKIAKSPEFAYTSSKREKTFSNHGIEFFSVDGQDFSLPASEMNQELSMKLSGMVKSARMAREVEPII